jgi:hypothetical protein
LSARSNSSKIFVLSALFQAGSGVGDAEGEAAVFSQRYLDQHAAGLGELDGVADQVEQYLPHPSDVRGDFQRRIGCDVDGDLDVLFMRL